MAMALRAPWIAAYVDTGSFLGDAARQRLARNLNLAEQLGAETVTLGGEDMAEEIVKYAQSKNVTKIIIGKTGEPRWRELMGRSVVSKVLRRSGDIDVYVIRGQKDPADESKAQISCQPAQNQITCLSSRQSWLLQFAPFWPG